MCPLSGSYNLGIKSRIVVLPLPDLPTSATVSPGLIEKLILFNILFFDDGYLK